MDVIFLAASRAVTGKLVAYEGCIVISTCLAHRKSEAAVRTMLTGRKIACSAGVLFFWWVSVEFSVWSPFWVCTTSGAGRREMSGEGVGKRKKKRAPVRPAIAHDPKLGNIPSYIVM